MNNLEKYYSHKSRSQNLLILILFTIIDSFVALIFSAPSIISVGLIGTSLIILLQYPSSCQLDKQLILAKVIGTLCVVLVYYFNIDVFGQPYWIGSSDDAVTEERAKMFLEEGCVWPWDFPMFVNDKGYIWLVAMFMKIAGGAQEYCTIAPRIFNIDILIAEAILCVNICTRRYDFTRKQAVFLFYLVSCFPNSVYISSYVFRDTVCSFLMLLTYCLSDDLLRNRYEKVIINTQNKIVKIFLLVLVLFSSFWIRVEALFFEIVFICIAFLKDKKLSLKTIPFKQKILLIIVVVGAVALFAYSGILGSIQEKMTLYNEMRSDESSDSSNPIFRLIFTLPILPFGIFLRIAFGLVSPLPVQLLNFTAIFQNGLNLINFIIAIGVTAQIYYLPYFIKVIKNIDKLFLTFFCVFLSFVISTFTFRHVLLFYPYFWLLLTRSYNESTIKERTRFKSISLLGVGFIFLAYGMTKLL